MFYYLNIIIFGYHPFNMRACLKHFRLIIPDINECNIIKTGPGGSNSTLAGCTQLCHNSIGSFSCSCRTGFLLQHDGKSCHGRFQTSILFHITFVHVQQTMFQPAVFFQVNCVSSTNNALSNKKYFTRNVSRNNVFLRNKNELNNVLSANCYQTNDILSKKVSSNKQYFIDIVYTKNILLISNI